MPFATISSKNQITLPAQVLSHLGIKSKDRVMVSEVNGEIRIKRVPSIWEFAGIAKSNRRYSVKEMREGAMSEAADRAMGRRK